MLLVYWVMVERAELVVYEDSGKTVLLWRDGNTGYTSRDISGYTYNIIRQGLGLSRVSSIDAWGGREFSLGDGWMSCGLGICRWSVRGGGIVVIWREQVAGETGKYCIEGGEATYIVTTDKNNEYQLQLLREECKVASSEWKTRLIGNGEIVRMTGYIIDIKGKEIEISSYRSKLGKE